MQAYLIAMGPKPLALLIMKLVLKAHLRRTHRRALLCLAPSHTSLNSQSVDGSVEECTLYCHHSATMSMHPDRDEAYCNSVAVVRPAHSIDAGKLCLSQHQEDIPDELQPATCIRNTSSVQDAQGKEGPHHSSFTSLYPSSISHFLVRKLLIASLPLKKRSRLCQSESAGAP